MNHTSRNFALQLGALVALYATVTALITLLFGTITLSLPDAADSGWQLKNAAQSIRFAFATLVIVFPTLVVLTRKVNVIRRGTDNTYTRLTHWLIYLSLLIAGAILIGDAVAVVYGFLNGDLTLRFFLKAMVFGVVVATTFGYYLLDVKGYWQEHESHSLSYGGIVTAIVVASLIWSFNHIETPHEVREMRIDEEQISDLQNMQWAVDSYLTEHNELPANLSVVYQDTTVPTSPNNRTGYQYTLTESGFNLCAEFAHQSTEDQFEIIPTSIAPTEGVLTILNPYNWQHGIGEWCFERVVR